MPMPRISASRKALTNKGGLKEEDSGLLLMGGRNTALHVCA
jgi:hypothetical protein